jgi:hypothetical protein
MNKILAFQYLIKLINDWATQDFSQKSLTKEHYLLFPFFVCTANGNRDAMFKIFNNFYANENGIYELEIERYLLEGDNLNLLIEQIVTNAKGANFSDLNSDIKNHIEHAIKHLRKLNEDTLDLDFYELSNLSKNHTSWMIFDNAIVESNLTKEDRKEIIINVEILKAEKSQLASITEFVSL